jgi:hypothetical protein
MPLIPQTMQGLIQARGASQLLSGNKFPDVVSAVSSATCQYVLTTSIVNSTNVALGPGAGTQTGTIMGLIPTAMSSLMQAKAASMALAGRDIMKIFDSVSFGVCNAMNSLLLQGTIIGAGPGTGTGKISGLVPTGLEALIFTQSVFRLISGRNIKDLISAMAFGICNHIMTTATVLCTDIGVAASPPVGPVPIPAAPGIGRLV